MTVIPNSTDLLVVIQTINAQEGWLGVGIIILVFFMVWATLTSVWDTRRALLGGSITAGITSIFLAIMSLVGAQWVAICILLTAVIIYWIKSEE